MPYAVDFETYYKKPDYSLSTMNSWLYVYDPRFDAYMVGVYGPGIEWVGAPNQFDWSRLAGADLLMHNAGFDGLVIRRLQRDGVIPATVDTTRLFDTSDLCAFLRVARRNLDFAAKELLGVSLDKGMRNWMNGKTALQAQQAGKYDELAAYCLRDAKTCHDLWHRFGALWPAEERELSRLNREACWHGMAVDREAVEQAVQSLQKQLFDAQSSLPWVASGEKALGPKALRLQGRLDGIPVPASLDQRLEEVKAWEKEYGPKFPWVRAVRDVRRINTWLSRALSLRDSIRSDDTFSYQIMYHQASTGRFSGRSRTE